VPIRRSLLLAAIVMAAPSAAGDVTTPNIGAPSSSPPTSMRTRWPAVLPGARSCVVSAWTPATDDVLRWSNASGAASTIERPSGRNWPLPPALAVDPPRALSWVRHGRPGISHGYMGEPMPHNPHTLDLFLSCGDDVVRWECDDRQASCRTSFAISLGDPRPERAHHADWERLKEIIAAGAGARAAVVRAALQLAGDACAGERCADVVARAVQQLRAVDQEPPWKVARADALHLELTAPGALEERLSCDGTAYDCLLTLRGGVRFRLHGHADTDPYEELDGPTWAVRSPSARGSGYSLEDEAIR
jgi:hypothetical protein